MEEGIVVKRCFRAARRSFIYPLSGHMRQNPGISMATQNDGVVWYFECVDVTSSRLW